MRTSGRALARLEELAVQAAGSDPVDVTVAHLASPDRAGQLQSELAIRLADNLEGREVGVCGARRGARRARRAGHARGLRRPAALSQRAALREEPEMSRQTISTDAAPKSAAYSQAVVAAGLVFVSGQAAFDPGTGELVGTTIQEQTRQCLKNVAAILEAAGSSLDKLVSATFILRDPGDFAGMNEEWLTWFPTDPPARQGAALPVDVPGLLVSVAAIAACWHDGQQSSTGRPAGRVVHRPTRPRPDGGSPDLPRFDPCARDEPSSTTRPSSRRLAQLGDELSAVLGVRSARPEPPDH